jgi:S-adenosylmethionine:tRNA ribosyltransferase-isomerase
MHFTDLDRYNYSLPQEFIRKIPLEPRDSTRLFVYDTKTDVVTFDTFRNIAKYLPAHSLMVLNDTKVWPARLWLKKATGGKIEVLVLVNEWDGKGSIPALVDRKVSIGDELTFLDGSKFITEDQQEQKFFFRLESKQSLQALLQEFGTTPIPHYLEGEEKGDESLLRQRYQTVFAAAGASVAAPTASLHFTEAVFAGLREKNIETAKVTLNVGLGTFAPLREENFQTGKLHGEWVVVSDETIKALEKAKANKHAIIAVGTTTTRTLETLAKHDKSRALSLQANLFIYPPYEFCMTDILITNFHLPRTSLMLLVDAFLQYKGAKRGVVNLYEEAIREGFSFYSFGDSMLIL